MDELWNANDHTVADHVVALTRAVMTVVDARRRCAGMSQREVAKRAGITDRSYRLMITKNEGGMNLRSLVGLANAVGVTPEALLNEAATRLTGLSALVADDRGWTCGGRS